MTIDMIRFINFLGMLDILNNFSMEFSGFLVCIYVGMYVFLLLPEGHT